MTITIMGKEEFIRRLAALPEGAQFYVGDVESRHDSIKVTTMDSPWELPTSFEVDVSIRWSVRT